ncbi:MAG: IS66 family transposase [Planctomycetota bacterium]
MGEESGTDLAREIERLKVELSDTTTRCATLERDKAALERKLADALHRLSLLLHAQYGRRSERYEGHPELPFPGEESEPVPPPHVDEAPDEEYEAVGKKRRRRGVTRLRGDLPRERVVIEPSDEERLCPCCGEERVAIGEEITELLDYRPASFVIREIVRPKLVCRMHEEAGITVPALPSRPIGKGMAAEGLLAQVVTAKYRDHLPLYRQAGIYRRQGVEIAESTMGDWVRDVAVELSPVVAEVRRQALASGYVRTDDTPITVLDRAHPKGSKRGFLWVYLGAEQGDCLFDFTAGRSRDGPARVLEGYEGHLQADAYGGYDSLYKDGRIVEVGCMAHARRRFVEAMEVDPERSAIAVQVLRELYGIERHAKDEGMTAEERRALRQAESHPLFEELCNWLGAEQDQVLPQSPIGKAIGYMLRHRSALGRYIEDGRLEIDNNRSERAMRQVAVGRKNWLFAGSEAGGERAATLYSLVVGCWELGVDPFAYLRDVLERLGTTPSSEIARLTPRGWAAEQGAI